MILYYETADKMQCKRLSPPYSPSPDLAPMDFRVFQEVKSQLRGIRFASKQELTVAAKRIVLSFDADCYGELRFLDPDETPQKVASHQDPN
ncbi:hypothetical protein DPMN_125104, partial [Dreissena polymorpha]